VRATATHKDNLSALWPAHEWLVLARRRTAKATSSLQSKQPHSQAAYNIRKIFEFQSQKFSFLQIA
jgi:hypothetical protein